MVLVKQEAQQQETVAQLQHFESALQYIKPSNFNEYQTKVGHRGIAVVRLGMLLMSMGKIPDIRFTDLYGIDDAIHDLKVSPAALDCAWEQAIF
jgi:hypothetical protein